MQRRCVKKIHVYILKFQYIYIYPSYIIDLIHSYITQVNKDIQRAKTVCQKMIHDVGARRTAALAAQVFNSPLVYFLGFFASMRQSPWVFSIDLLYISFLYVSSRLYTRISFDPRHRRSVCCSACRLLPFSFDVFSSKFLCIDMYVLVSCMCWCVFSRTFCQVSKYSFSEGLLVCRAHEFFWAAYTCVVSHLQKSLRHVIHAVLF